MQIEQTRDTLIHCATTWPRAYARRFGLKPPLSLIFYENFSTCAKENPGMLPFDFGHVNHNVGCT